MNTEAIVNTANDHASVGTGCDHAVYMAAGYEDLLKYREDQIGFVPEGNVFLTPGFALQAKYIIHAVSPLYQGGGQGEEEKLRSCYTKSLQLAKKHHIKSIAFPLISTGGFGYPKEEGIRIAVDEINAFLLHNEMDIYLVVFDAKATTLGEKLYPDLEAYIDQTYVQSQNKEEYQDADIGWERRVSCAAPVLYQTATLFPEAIFDFEEQHESKLEERMQHMSDTFSQYLMYLIRDKNMKNVEVWKRAIVDKKVFSKIKNNPDYHPQKLTALCLCIGAKLNLDESKDLLARAGYALSPCDKTDIIFSYFIENKIYDMIELDIQLEEHGLPCIIS
jgi:O-acetyl-ADP-ribose deacetylase (regulator of RNase III)